MKIKFLGGSSGVTGSKTLMTFGKKKYLVDYGLFQGSSHDREKNWINFKDANQISGVFLTHAHIDHSGLLPRLWRDGFRGKIFCTQETFLLCKILLEDSARIHEEDANFAREKQYSRHKNPLPLYTQEEVVEVLKHFEVVHYHQDVIISQNFKVCYFCGGHILGSSFIRFVWNQDGRESSIVFSGDLGHKRNILLKQPDLLCKTDFLVLESTYGNKLHPRIPALDVLALYLNTILKRKGVAIIPSFSVGRTQDVLYLVKKLMDEERVPKVPVFLDSPLARKANKIFNECYHKKFIKNEICDEGIYPSSFIEIESMIDSRKLNAQEGPMIIISASGMIDGGRVVHHVKQRISNEKNGLILVGFQPEGTKGRLLLDGIKDLRLHKQVFKVNADIFYINSLSAHADYLDHIEWLQNSQILPKWIILNHGEDSSSQHLKIILESQLETKVTISKINEVFDLNAMLS